MSNSTMIEGDDIALFQLMALESSLLLETKSLKFSILNHAMPSTDFKFLSKQDCLERNHYTHITMCVAKLFPAARAPRAARLAWY